MNSFRVIEGQIVEDISPSQVPLFHRAAWEIAEKLCTNGKAVFHRAAWEIAEKLCTNGKADVTKVFDILDSYFHIPPGQPSR